MFAEKQKRKLIHSLQPTPFINIEKVKNSTTKLDYLGNSTFL